MFALHRRFCVIASHGNGIALRSQKMRCALAQDFHGIDPGSAVVGCDIIGSDPGCAT